MPTNGVSRHQKAADRLTHFRGKDKSTAARLADLSTESRGTAAGRAVVSAYCSRRLIWYEVGFKVLGLKVLGLKVLGLKVLGLKVLGLQELGFRR